jgi:hypothetical protein
VTVHELSRADARRIAVSAQLLDSMRSAGLLDVVRHLTLLQIDPTAAVAPSADLVAWSRLGASYRPAELAAALEQRTLLELRAMIRPSEDLALYRADMACWEQPRQGEQPGWRASFRDWVRANDACRRDILDRLGSSGPAAVPASSRYLQGAVAVDRVDQQPQRLEAAGVHGGARRGRDVLGPVHGPAGHPPLGTGQACGQVGASPGIISLPRSAAPGDDFAVGRLPEPGRRRLVLS